MDFQHSAKFQRNWQLRFKDILRTLLIHRLQTLHHSYRLLQFLIHRHVLCFRSSLFPRVQTKLGVGLHSYQIVKMYRNQLMLIGVISVVLLPSFHRNQNNHGKSKKGGVYLKFIKHILGYSVITVYLRRPSVMTIRMNSGN